MEGQCYPKETLRGLMALCQKHHIHLISDEIYALSVFDTGNPDAVPFTSVLSFDATGLIDDDLLHVLYGMSKVSGFNSIWFSTDREIGFRGTRPADWLSHHPQYSRLSCLFNIVVGSNVSPYCLSFCV